MTTCNHLKTRLYDGSTICACDRPGGGELTVVFNGGGYKHSREGFHGQTIGERREHWIKRGRAKGLDPVPV